MHALIAVAVLALHPAPVLRHPHSTVHPAPAWRSAAVRACSAEEAGIRVNKALRATHSRREADRLVDAGRVTVNGVAATSGDRLVRGDAVRLDGELVDWERLNPPPEGGGGGGGGGGSRFVYLKYWKPRGVVCTTDRRQRGNVLDELGPLPGVTDRVYPIGRLDAESTGLLLLLTRTNPNPNPNSNPNLSPTPVSNPNLNPNQACCCSLRTAGSSTACCANPNPNPNPNPKPSITPSPNPNPD